MAAAAWSWVLKILQEHQRTLAPKAARVSMSTPVWMVMCREPLMSNPLKGCARPNSAKPMSFTLESAMACYDTDEDLPDGQNANF